MMRKINVARRGEWRQAQRSGSAGERDRKAVMRVPPSTRRAASMREAICRL